jgi:hypothetical protein
METNLADILAERGSRYGEFKRHAMITMLIKDVIAAYGQHLAPDQREALDMTAHKIGRILNGDPNHVDSWIDIAGYTKLVADRLIKDQSKVVACAVADVDSHL